MKKNEKEFDTIDKDGKPISLVCIRPNQKILNDAKLEYNVAYASAIRRGCLMKAEVDDIVETRNLWSKDHEVKLQDMRKELRSMEISLNKLNKLNKDEASLQNGKELSKKIAEHRTAITNYVNKGTELYNRTAESIASSMQNEFLCAHCILNKTDRKPYFANIDNLREMEDTRLVIDCTSTLMLFLMDIDNTPDTPEKKWLTDNDLRDSITGLWKKNGKLYDDVGRIVDPITLQFINEDGKFVDEFGFIVELETTNNDTPITESV